MSKMYVNELLPKDAARVAIPGGAQIAGHIIQVVKSIYSGSTGVSTSTWSSLGRSLTITPLYANSHIYITYSATSYFENGFGYFTFYRNGTNLYNLGGYNTNPSVQAITQLGNSSGSFYFPSVMAYYDYTHNSTSALTYSVYAKTGGSGTTYFPPGSSDAATFVAMEIAQ